MLSPSKETTMLYLQRYNNKSPNLSTLQQERSALAKVKFVCKDPLERSDHRGHRGLPDTLVSLDPPELKAKRVSLENPLHPLRLLCSHSEGNQET